MIGEYPLYKPCSRTGIKPGTLEYMRMPRYWLVMEIHEDGSASDRLQTNSAAKCQQFIANTGQKIYPQSFARD